MWRFLPSEMMVILGLSEDANRTDAEIAEAYGMNKGTVASVRRRLLDSGAVYFVNVPSFNKLGCELTAFHIGTTDPGVPSDTKANNYIEFCDSSPNIFHGVVGGGNVSLHAVFRDATEVESFLQEHSRFFSGTRRPSRATMESNVYLDNGEDIRDDRESEIDLRPAIVMAIAAAAAIGIALFLEKRRRSDGTKK